MQSDYTFICGLRTGSRGESALSESPSQSQSSSAIYARGTQTTQDPSTHYNRVISAGWVEAGWRLSLSSVEASERVLSRPNLSKMLEMRNSPSLLPSLAIILSPPACIRRRATKPISRPLITPQPPQLLSLPLFNRTPSYLPS